MNLSISRFKRVFLITLQQQKCFVRMLLCKYGNLEKTLHHLLLCSTIPWLFVAYENGDANLYYSINLKKNDPCTVKPM